MATKHAVLSASSSERWLNCPPSARLCETYEDKSSDYAAEGTDAHALAEARLKQALGIPTEDPVENLTWYNAEMEDCAQGYAAYVVELLETAKQTCWARPALRSFSLPTLKSRKGNPRSCWRATNVRR